LAVLAAAVSASAWALIGLGLLALAAGRVKKRLADERAERAGFEARLVESTG
jgi:hypothetical protein